MISCGQGGTAFLTSGCTVFGGYGFWYFGSMLVLWCLVVLVVLWFCGAGCFLDFGCFFRLVGVLWFVLWFWVGGFCVSGGFCCFC